MGAMFADIAMWEKVESPVVKQNAVCGIQIIAKTLAPQGFASLVPNSLKAIQHVMSGPKEDEE